MPSATPSVSGSPSVHPTGLPSKSPSPLLITNSPINPTKSTSTNPKPTAVISIPSTLSLDNFVMPETQEEFDAVVSILENTISQTIEVSLSDNQILSSVDVLSIGGNRLCYDTGRELYS
jgi:hypothetical protein